MKNLLYLSKNATSGIDEAIAILGLQIRTTKNQSKDKK